MSDADTTAGLPFPPSPAPGRRARPMPQNIADFLAILHVLIGYGLHLAETLERRAAARGFSVIAQFFGTARVATIRARLARGLLRAMALEQVLLARAARGRDLVFYKPRDRAPRQPAGRVQPRAHRIQPSRIRPARHPDTDEPPDPGNLPTVGQLQAEIRRHPVGRVLADICSDLGISPSLCPGNFWFEITCGIMCYRGNLPRLMKEFRRREIRFCDTEADRNPALGWPEPTRDGNRRVLGFFIGEPPVTPFPCLTCLGGKRPSPNRPDHPDRVLRTAIISAPAGTSRPSGCLPQDGVVHGRPDSLSPRAILRDPGAGDFAPLASSASRRSRGLPPNAAVPAAERPGAARPPRVLRVPCQAPAQSRIRSRTSARDCSAPTCCTMLRLRSAPSTGSTRNANFASSRRPCCSIRRGPPSIMIRRQARAVGQQQLQPSLGVRRALAELKIHLVAQRHQRRIGGGGSE